MPLVIEIENPLKDDLAKILTTHLEFCKSVTPAENVYALEVENLVSNDITVFGARENGQLIGVGALRQLDSDHAELKSMHTLEAFRGAGAGSAIVSHILDFARAKGISRVSLETGNFEEFAPARSLYLSFGFKECEVFGEYLPSSVSVCMTKSL